MCAGSIIMLYSTYLGTEALRAIIGLRTISVWFNRFISAICKSVLLHHFIPRSSVSYVEVKIFKC